ncbi:MAG: glycoside hydrolase family 127 protein [Clostridia bacterium]|nr:glycoside hydrolase family 127 protein [Clostridia bacterium]
MDKTFSWLAGGVLFDRFSKVRDNFYKKIDENIHADTYRGDEHELTYAEPEFTGKFMDICARYYEREGDERALRKGMAVVTSIKENIRDDGYLGMLGDGNELKMFSVWNQSFTLYGLTRMYEATGDESIKALVIKAANWIYNTFTGEEPPDILDALNNGSQHITCLYSMLKAYMVTGDVKYLEFVGRVIDYCETTDMNLLSFDDILTLRSQKGIEMIVIYLGVLKYGLITENSKAIKAAERYFEQIRDTQIRNTGNGTIVESWRENGNAARFMPTEEKPNETCVAVGIIELATLLFHVFPEAKYLDVIEKTLFNHMCGSLEKSGSDFAYYQGNFGRKIYRTAGGMYQCCRYRGFTLFSYLNDMLYYYNDETLIPMVYTSSRFERDGVKCIQTTDYPKSGEIKFSVKSEHPINLKLRVPEWCDSHKLSLSAELVDGYLTVELPAGESEILLSLEEKVVINSHEIDGKPYLSVNYGPLLLAHDTHFGGELCQELSVDAEFKRAEAGCEAIVRLDSKEMTLVDFASAGGNDPENDTYTVFIPRK